MKRLVFKVFHSSKLVFYIVNEDSDSDDMFGITTITNSQTPNQIPGIDEYGTIENILKTCDPNGWFKYLKRFPDIC